jgi:predicted DsbA family dithiol-disulfide isomerase
MPLEGVPRPLKPGEGKELSESVRRLSSEIGLKMIRSPFIACSRPALEAAEYAKEHGKFDTFHLAVFKAYWEEGKNIGLRHVLRDVAEDIVLDWNELERCLDEGLYSERIERQSEEAKAMGITGIPTGIIGDYVIVGAQPYKVFQRAMEMSLKQGPK